MSNAVLEIGKKAAAAKSSIANAGSAEKDRALRLIAEALIRDTDKILAANEKDVNAAKENGMSSALIDRLSLTKDRIKAIADAVLEIISLPDPVGRVVSGSTRPNGIRITKVSVPLGVIAVIYEARPNVTADAAALCLKSGNAVILRGGKEAFNSNMEIVNSMRSALSQTSISPDCIQFIEDTSRESATALMRLNGYVDVLIPRGGSGLIKSVIENSTVPVIETGTGNCHVYVDKSADIDMATEIVFNAKTSRPSVCNAAEKLLIHKDIAQTALPKICEKLKEKNVEIRADESALKLIPDAKPATDEDWDTEYLDYIIAVKAVNDIDEAIKHINTHGTKHSEAIVTESFAAAEKFCAEVDAAAVYVNASTRFTDGGEFGFGAEIGISTQKLHARGPVGLPELTSYKYVVRGEGQIR
ncbi:MAG: glutamate-5-semialdehyde dehydrogenase [Clostridiales bacterium]|jgi:glutamate-5-semialdehyde dehydrogenase|nr:glutamate-5-semialdehyde dehydrogenase [Clostridiales bacterium]